MLLLVVDRPSHPPAVTHLVPVLGGYWQPHYPYRLELLVWLVILLHVAGRGLGGAWMAPLSAALALVPVPRTHPYQVPYQVEYPLLSSCPYLKLTARMRALGRRMLPRGVNTERSGWIREACRCTGVSADGVAALHGTRELSCAHVVPVDGKDRRDRRASDWHEHAYPCRDSRALRLTAPGVKGARRRCSRPTSSIFIAHL